MRLSLAILSYNHFVQEPAAASAFAIMSDSHPEDLPDSYCLDYELIHLVMNKEAYYILYIQTALWIQFIYIN